MPNIQFNYLYRDGGNYKKYDSVIFANPNNIDLTELETLVRSKLIDHEWFYVDQWKVPDLHFGTWDNELDHTFHEFESIEYTEGPATSNVTLADFTELVRNTRLF